MTGICRSAGLLATKSEDGGQSKTKYGLLINVERRRLHREVKSILTITVDGVRGSSNRLIKRR